MVIPQVMQVSEDARQSHDNVRGNGVAKDTGGSKQIERCRLQVTPYFRRHINACNVQAHDGRQASNKNRKQFDARRNKNQAHAWCVKHVTVQALIQME